ncbi:MAG: hypothetical protein ALAOOOJD_01447 [bacterium]|nr:hypothetical protein [bacterium]
MKKYLIVFAVACLGPASGWAQSPPAKLQPAAKDTLKSVASKKDLNAERTAKPDSARPAAEMELESISIEAIIEKPNVDIIPKRLAPELEEVEFVARSFDRELKEVPKDLLLLDDDLDRVAKLEGLKLLLEKKKKKQDKE